MQSQTNFSSQSYYKLMSVQGVLDIRVFEYTRLGKIIDIKKNCSV